MRTASAARLRAVLRECSRRGKTERFLEQLAPEHVAWLLFDWEVWARDDQLPPESDFTTWLQARIALIGETLGDARAVMVEGVSGLLAVHADHERPNFEPSKKQITWKNGAIAHLFSAEDPESLRGPQHSQIWADDAHQRCLYRLFSHHILRSKRYARNHRAGARSQRGVERYLRGALMTGSDLREALKWSLVLAAAGALWCGVLDVREARGADTERHDIPAFGEQIQTSGKLRPVWVIVVFETRGRKLVGIGEFVFPTYQACQEGAARARRELSLTLRPACYLRWMKTSWKDGA